VDFERSSDQEALAEVVRAVVTGRFTMERIRRHEGTRSAVDPDDWAALGEAGVFSLTLAEDQGGVGLGLADAAVVFEELGRGLVPGPLVPSLLAGSFREANPLQGAAEGTVVVGSVVRPGPDEDPLVVVDHFDALDALIIEEPNGTLSVLETDELEAEPVRRPLDPLTPLSIFAPLPPGEALGDRAAAARFRRDRQTLTGALGAGMATATCAMAVDYAKERQQFGRPIGAFQAVKHLCADMLVRAEVARAAVDAAALTADQPETGDPERLAAGAALLATEAAVANAKTAIQIFGGMGFTWEVPLHLYLMRARVHLASLGRPDELARSVADRY
jgi:alkylation response protein AidB-like acyl-CoA dehydrogenase